VVLLTGACATVLLVGWRMERPPVRLVQVEGMSMYPTLKPGNALLFARVQFMPGSIVLAAVGEDEPVIKRITSINNTLVRLNGDNRDWSMTYRVPADSIRGVMVCRVPVQSPFGDHTWDAFLAATQEPPVAGRTPEGPLLRPGTL